MEKPPSFLCLNLCREVLIEVTRLVKTEKLDGEELVDELVRKSKPACNVLNRIFAHFHVSEELQRARIY